MKLILKGMGILLFISAAFVFFIQSKAPKSEVVIAYEQNETGEQRLQAGSAAPLIILSKQEPVASQPSISTQSVSLFRSGTTIELPLEEYLIGVVAAEMPVSFELEALKAQAVAARTFVRARDFIVDDTTASQVYKSNDELREQWHENYDEYYEKVKQAVFTTAGQILTYNGTPITAAFFSSCMGSTNNSEDYWTSATPYLRSVSSPWDQAVSELSRSVDVDTQTLVNCLGGNDVQILSTYTNGYVQEVNVNGRLFSGRQIRELLGLASNCFTVEVIENGLRFTTYGSGHGIGMSQYGAQGMALEGYDYQAILHHYYTDVEIETLNV